MKHHLLTALISLALGSAIAQAAIPSCELYPFPGYDLVPLRAKTKAESISNSKELNEAWQLYRELQGSWLPQAPKPRDETIARFELLLGKLEALPKPPWFSEAMNSAHSGSTQLAEKVGDPTFEQQKATPEYQVQKALAILYLTGHELDRAGAAQTAGKYLTVLSMTHPWDWQIHSLHSRFLVEARIPGPAWQAARQGLFLNPEPDLNDLKYFAYIGSLVAKEKWPEIQAAMRQAAVDDKIAELAIVDSAKFYGPKAQVTIVDPKTR